MFSGSLGVQRKAQVDTGKEEAELGLGPAREIGLGVRGMPGRGTDVYPKASKGYLSGSAGRMSNS